MAVSIGVAENADSGFDPVAGGRARRRDDAEVEFNRIVAFSDGVFAIAITLVVLGLFIPQGESNFTQTLLRQWTDLFAYGISFAVIGKFWLAHHRFFAALERFDGPLMGFNLAYLAFIGLVPFTSQVLGDYGHETSAVVLYAINLACVTLAFYAQVLYAYRADLIKPEARALESRYAGPANLLLAGVFIVSIPVAFVSTTVATAMWLGVFVVGRRAANRLADAIS